MADLVDGIAARPTDWREALEQARRAAGPALEAMLHHDEPRARAAACAVLAGRTDENRLAAILPRASDTDWRVRAAAFQALAAAGRLRGEPLRDTPLDEREEILLAWMDARDPKAAAPLAPELCELYAGDRHVEFGRPLAARCLACHAGAEPAPFAASETCGRCHGRTWQEWSASAHAQSLSHLRLATVNPATRQPQQMDFGEVRGMGCRECHRPAVEPQAPIPRERAGLTACPFRFRKEIAAADSCSRCHTSTAAEWRAWLAGPQPRLAVWPPGEVQADRRGDTRTCVDCHMPPGPMAADKTEHVHAWAARRDVGRLQEGVAVRSEAEKGPGPFSASPQIRFRLINLSGHACPTGSRRRALRILAGPTGGEMRIVAELSPLAGQACRGLTAGRRGRLAPMGQPALAPGEAREFLIPAPAAAATVTIRLQYCRDVTDPAAGVSDVFSVEEDLRRWVGPEVGPGRVQTSDRAAPDGG